MQDAEGTETVQGCEPPSSGALRLLATDITTQTQAIFPADADAYWEPGQVHPARFICASMSSPLLLKPMKVSPIPYQNEEARSHAELWRSYQGKIPKKVCYRGETALVYLHWHVADSLPSLRLIVKGWRTLRDAD